MFNLNWKSGSMAISLCCILLSVTSCSKKLETEPLYLIQNDLVWDNTDSLGTVANFFLYDLYNYLPNGFNRVGSSVSDFMDAGTDDALPSRNNRTVQYFTNGRINSSNNPDDVWGNSYAGIRRVNIFLKNVDSVPNVTLKTYGKAEARFIRALCYFELVKRYGGVPLIGDTIFTVNSNLQLPRNTFADCVKYIVSECDSVKNKNRVEPVSDAEWGRIPRGAAIALKSRILLYAASPLYNGGGVETDPAKKALTGYPSYDATRWQAALDAAQELINLNYYALQPSFGTVFTTKKNAEVILAKQRGNGYDIETNNAPVGYTTPAVSYGYTSPTQDLVDAFPMNNGLSIANATSGYSASAPYANRDPRLGFTVFYNGYKWLSRNVETFTGGKDEPGGNAVQTNTGYYLRKFMADFSGNTTYTNQSHNFIIFRYAEILLNQAEALNELGRTTEAYTSIIALRKRAGIIAGTGNLYGLKTSMTQSEMRTIVQNERRIELAFEEHRFWDVRRWKIADVVFNGYVHGMNITKNTSGVLTYNVVNVTPIQFTQKMYHMPVPYSETTKNLQLIQNEGW
jgi:hypothetical protein